MEKADQKNQEQDERIKKIEKALRDFWRDHGRVQAVNGRHTDVVIEPKFLLGETIHPHVAKRLVQVYLSQLTAEKIMGGEVRVLPDTIHLYDQRGKLVLEVNHSKVINGMVNRVTGRLGRELSRRERKAGGSYVPPKDSGDYSYGEIKAALAEFLMEAERNDSQNPFKQATLLLCREADRLTP